jgi:hypothetical protein
MESFITIYYWVRIAILAIVVLLAVLAAIRLTRRHGFAAWREIAFVIVTAAAFGGLVTVVDRSFSLVWAVVLVVLGALAGFGAGRTTRLSRGDDGRVAIRRSPLAPWLWAAGAVLAAMTLLFGTSYLFALAMLVLAFALGTVLGQVAAELVGSRSVPAAGPPVSDGTTVERAAAETAPAEAEA